MSIARRLLVFALALTLALSASADSQDYLEFKWNQSTKEVVSGLAFADLDADGASELYVSASSEGAVYGYDALGDVLWKFQAPSYLFTLASSGSDLLAGAGSHVYSVSAEGESAWKAYTAHNPVKSIAAASLDDDAGSEFVYGTYDDKCSTNYVTALDGDGQSLWSYSLGYFNPQVIRAADFSGDGASELVVGTVYRARSSASSKCTPAYTSEASVIALDASREVLWEYLTESGVLSLASGDLDGDGTLEVALGTYSAVVVLDSAGTKLFSVDSDVPVPAVAIADVNSDGRGEVLVAGKEVIALDSAGSVLWTGDTLDNVYTLTAADLNNDGAAEVVAGSEAVYVFDGNGKQLFKGEKQLSIHELAAADLDGDGYLEVAAASVKKVLVYGTGFSARRQQALAFYNMAKDRYTGEDYNLSLAYAERARKIFLELGDMDSVAKTMKLSDTVSARMRGEAPPPGEIEDISDEVPSPLEVSKSLTDYLGDIPRFNLGVELSEAKDVLLRNLVALILLVFIVVFLVLALFIRSHFKRGVHARKERKRRERPDAPKFRRDSVRREGVVVKFGKKKKRK